MKSKKINREVKISTITDYLDGSKKITTDYKAYFDNRKRPEIVYKKVKYRFSNGKIKEEDKSFFLRRTPDGFNNDETNQKKTHTESDSESDSNI